MSTENTAILLISHGSSLSYGKETFTEIHKKFKEVTGLPTEVGYMKVEEPSISSAIDILKNNNPNLKRIIALPVFLAPGIHTNIDIPILLGLNPLEVDPRCPDGNYPDSHYLMTADKVDFDGEIDLLQAIGPDDALLEFINKRINEVSDESDLKTGILLVSHGSRLKYNKEFISTLYDKFSKTTDLPTNFGFMELVEPTIPQAINKLLDENTIERLIVVPVFLAPGVHTTRDIPTILGLIDDKQHKHHHHHHEHSHHHHHHDHDLEKIDFDGEVLYTNPIGADDILINILKGKVEEIL